MIRFSCHIFRTFLIYVALVVFMSVAHDRVVIVSICDDSLLLS